MVNETAVIRRFLRTYATLPEFADRRWVPVKKVPVGILDTAVALPKEIDLILVEDNGNLGQLKTLYGLREWGFSGGKRVNYGALVEQALRGGADVWIVEAESTKRKLWEAIGQSFGYRALFSANYPGATVKGCFIPYPAEDGRDEAIEGAVRIINEELSVPLVILPVPKSGLDALEEEEEEYAKPRKDADLRFYGGGGA